MGDRGGIKIHDLNVSLFKATDNMFIFTSCVRNHSECLGSINEQIKDPCPHSANILGSRFLTIILNNVVQYGPWTPQ